MARLRAIAVALMYMLKCKYEREPFGRAGSRERETAGPSDRPAAIPFVFSKRELLFKTRAVAAKCFREKRGERHRC